VTIEFSDSTGPFDESLLLVYLRVESDVPLSSDEKGLVDEVCCKMSGLSAKWSLTDRESRKAAFAQWFEKILRSDPQITKMLLTNLEWVVD
jgi:oligoendopeptidase F